MFVLLSVHLQPCGQLLGKGWPLSSLVCYVLFSFCHFPIWCPGSGIVSIPDLCLLTYFYNIDNPVLSQNRYLLLKKIFLQNE